MKASNSGWLKTSCVIILYCYSTKESRIYIYIYVQIYSITSKEHIYMLTYMQTIGFCIPFVMLILIPGRLVPCAGVPL